jgi:hypothetical protein
MTAHDIDTPTTRARRAIAVLLAMLTVLLVAPAAHATEEASAPAEGEALTYDELEQQASSRAQEFFPDEYAEPSFFQWLSVPVLLAGLVVAAALLGAYLWWQPRFAAERRQKERRR